MLRCLGGLSLENGGRPIVGAGNQPQRLAILSVIARGAQRGVSRDRLQAMFWPDSDTERARGALNQALYALRRDVGEREFILGTITVRLNPDAIACDAGEFERALDDGAPERAVGLYSGPFLDGVHVDATAEFEEWVESQRERLAQRYVLALEQLARGASDRKDLPAALDWWRRLCEVDPLNSTAALGLVQALAATGDRAGAVLHAGRHQEALRTELDLPPDAALAAFVALLRTAPKPGGHPEPGKHVDVGVRSAPPPAASADIPVPAVHAEIPGRTAARPARRLIGAAALVTVLGAAWFALARRTDDLYAIGRATQLTFEPGLEIDPALSPDGRSVAYTAGSLSYMRIYVRQAGGRAVRVLGDSSPGQRRPLWSPDGTQLLYLHGRSTQNLSLVPALGGTPRLIAPGYVTSAAWAPDGRRVAYVRKDTLYVQSIDGGDARVIGYYNSMYALAWSPDGKRIAFAAGNSKFAISDLSAFGTTGPSEILVVPADGGRPVAVTDLGSQNVSPAWAPDSRRLLFVSDRDGPRDVYVVRLGSSGAPAGPATRLTVGLSPHSISLSADGRRLAYSAFEQRSNIWAMPISPGIPLSQSAAIPVTTGSQFIEDMSVSGDGKRLYFDSGREGNADIYRMALPDGDPVRLTRDPAGDYYPSESPDGRWIAFYSLRYGSRDIMVMPTDGGAPQRVTTDTLDELWPRWSPDSRSLIYALEDQSNRSGLNGMYVILRDTSGLWGQPRRVSLIANEPAWSPDGRTLLVAFDPVVWAIPAQGGPQRQIYAPRPGTDDPGIEVAQWMPDGQTLVMKSHDQNDIASFWSMPAAGGQLRLLGRLEDPSRASPRDELVTDGRRLYFTIHDRQSDIYVTEMSGLQ
ncbi:MAG: hypothetical protein H6Q77_762 [Gemmatimonadetes bacterium]|nr:hypothetical protein [Gemmatimonadota bacterium]